MRASDLRRKRRARRFAAPERAIDLVDARRPQLTASRIPLELRNIKAGPGVSGFMDPTERRF
jgi:hypothetical protein